MPFPPNRRHARYPCDLPVKVRVPRKGDALFEGRMLDIGMGGALLSTLGTIKGPVVYVLVDVESQEAAFRVRIARAIGMDKSRRKHYLYGVTFETEITNRRLLDKLIDKARISAPPASDIRRDFS